MWSSNHFSISSRFPCFSRSRFFRVKIFQGPGFSGSRFSRSRFSGSGSRSRVRVQVIEVAMKTGIAVKEVYKRHVRGFETMSNLTSKVSIVMTYDVCVIDCYFVVEGRNDKGYSEIILQEILANKIQMTIICKNFK